MTLDDYPADVHQETNQPQLEMYGRHADSQDETHQLNEDSDLDVLASSTRPRSLYYYFVRFGIRLSEWWFPEILSFVIAGGLFGIHIRLLHDYNFSPVTDWDRNPVSALFTTLPSAISFLSTLMRGAIGFPVASAIGQLKWHKYRGRPQAMDEFDRFDNASRGIMGSITFLLSGNFWSPASVGCAIIISGIFFGPFLQNTVRTETLPRLLDGETAFLQVAGSFHLYDAMASSYDTPSLLVAMPVMQANIARAWSYGLSYDASPSESITEMVYPHCPTNKTCQWSDWSTLRLRHDCKSAFVNQSSENPFSVEANVGTEREVNQNGTTSKVKTVLNMAAHIEVPSASAFARQGWSDEHAILAHVGIIGDYSAKEADREAVECVLYWEPIQGNLTWLNGNANATTRRPTYYTKRTDTGLPPANATFAYSNVTITAPWPCNFNTSLEVAQSQSDASCDYTITDKAQRGLWNTLHPYLTGYTRFHTAAALEERYFKGSNQANDLLIWDWIDERRFGHRGSLYRVVDRQMGNIAIYVSATMQKQSQNQSKGTLSEENNHFRARYHYLALPGGILVLSCLFFVVAAICTRRQNAWRNSQLPLLYHGLEQTGPKEWRDMRMTAMWEAALDTRVRLEADLHDSGFRLKRYKDVLVAAGEKGAYSKAVVTPEVI